MHQTSTITAPATARACATKLKGTAFPPMAISLFFSYRFCRKLWKEGRKQGEREIEDLMRMKSRFLVWIYILCVSNLTCHSLPSGPLIWDTDLNWYAPRGADWYGEFSYPRGTTRFACLPLPNLRFPLI